VVKILTFFGGERKEERTGRGLSLQTQRRPADKGIPGVSPKSEEKGQAAWVKENSHILSLKNNEKKS